MINQSPILITGCPRSGASMIAAAMKICGAFGGELSSRGSTMNSNIKICEQLVKPYLTANGIDPEGQHPLTGNNYIHSKWNELVTRLIEADGYTRGTWMYKDSRNALMWEVWNYAFPNARWIIVRRKTSDIIDSCLKTKYMNAYTTKEQWLEWVHEYEHRFVEMIEAGLNCKQIWPERMVNNDYSQMDETIQWAGLHWRKEVMDTIDPMLWNARQKERSTI